ncbi:MAG TPA: hypothetical protein VE689_07985, partial [Candidatus Udaeobacter sp.]|nr:hypothetical protein [Candidatus Udaeobacter sp.]
MHVIAWVGFVLLILGAAREVGASGLQEKMVIGFAAMNARVIPLWAAKDEGFFAKNDVDAEPIFIRGAPTLNAVLLSGDIQVGYMGGTVVMGVVVGGADLKILVILTN